MVHVHAQFRENTSMRFRVTVRKTKRDGQMDGRREGVAISPFPAFGAAGEKKLLTSFGENAVKCKKGTILNFWPLKNNLYSDSTKSYLWYVVNVIPKKLQAKKEKKLRKRFWDWPFPPLKFIHAKQLLQFVTRSFIILVGI